MSRRVALLAVVCWAGLALAAEDVRLVEVITARSGDQLVCNLRTEGLPGDKQLQSMRSGLEASVDLDLALVDEKERILGGNTITLRMGFDLWDEVFSVRADGGERRFQSLNDLQSYLADLTDLPVAPSAVLDSAGRCRLRVGLVVHAIAPDEQQRVEDVIAGEQRPRREGQDQQEASVSLGRLIRIFYKGGREGEGGHELASGWFTGKELSHAKD